MNGNDELLNEVIHTASSISRSIIFTFCERLEKFESDINESNLCYLTESLHQPEIRKELTNLLNHWVLNQSKMSLNELICALKTASLFDEDKRNIQSLELVWSGPTSENTTLRNTEQVLLEVIKKSQKSIIIISFVAYKIPEITKALIQAQTRGLNISFIIESSKHSQGRLTFDGIDTLGKELIPKSKLYFWPMEKRPVDEQGRCGLLHAKGAIGDDKYLLLSSANLTEYGLNFNMEMGLFVMGGNLPKQAKNHFKKLINKQILQEMSSDHVIK